MVHFATRTCGRKGDSHGPQHAGHGNALMPRRLKRGHSVLCEDGGADGRGAIFGVFGGTFPWPVIFAEGAVGDRRCTAVVVGILDMCQSAAVG